MSEIKFEYAQIGAVKIHYARAGSGAKLVLLLHGFPEFWYSWRRQIEALSDEYTIVAPDLRGYNLSDKPGKIEDYKIEKLVDDVCGLIRHLGFEKAAVVGHDWGASIAWATAQTHPEYVSKLCAMQIPPMSVWQKNQTFKQLRASWYMFFVQIPFLPEWLLTRNDYALLANSLKTSTANRGVFTDADIAEYKKSWRETAHLSSLLNYYRANLWSRIFTKANPEDKIRVPTLFIYGEKDFAVLPATVERVGEAVDAPFSEVRIPDSGHWVNNEASDVVTDSLREFLAEDFSR